jgi:acetylornithine deacetylase/succinyl-diaminopimelate desuccinylase-like protein
LRKKALFATLARVKRAFAFLLLFALPLHAVAQDAPTLKILQDLIRIDTSNPPGNEIAAARYVHDLLKKEGIDSEIIESAPGRGNLIARLKGEGSKPAMILLGHLDVVPAQASEWSVPPFAAEIKDGQLWGRGALDMKSLVAMEIQTLIRLKRENVKLDGDVILVLAADEEAGGENGAEFLVDNHWDKLDAKYLLNEGSVGVHKMGLHLFPIQTAEKGVTWFKMTARGASGHGSMPSPDNAVLKLAEAVETVSNHVFPMEPTPVLKEFLYRIAEKLPWWKRWGIKLLFAPGIGPAARHFAAKALSGEKAVRAILSDTVSPTMLSAGYKVNVIPAEATAQMDARILPGETPEAFLEKIRELVEDDIEVDLITGGTPNATAFDTDFFRTIEYAVKKADPEAVTAPMISAGATDSRFFREKGVICYGLIPLLLDPSQVEGLHGKNERIPVDGVEKGTQVVYDIVVAMEGKR